MIGTPMFTSKRVKRFALYYGNVIKIEDAKDKVSKILKFLGPQVSASFSWTVRCVFARLEAPEAGAVAQRQRVGLYVVHCITLRCGFVSPACAPKQGTLSYLLHPWTGMYMVVPSAETYSASVFRH